MPTFAQLVNETTKSTDGISFLPTLLGQPGQQKHDYLYWEFHEQGGKQAVLKGNWKAVLLNKYDEPKVELYDLTKDPSEENNLAGAFPDSLTSLITLMERSHSPNSAFPFSSKKNQ
jgi:arylsulfatase A-like enzyme